MNTKQITIVIVLIALGLFITPYLHILGGDYHTGLNINTTTQKYEHVGSYNHKGDLFMYTDTTTEQLDNDKYIVSWQPGGNSVKVVTEGHLKTRNYAGGFPSESMDFLVGQYAWVVQYEDAPNHLITIIDGKTNTINTNYVYVTSGNIQGNLANIYYETFPWIYENKNPFGDNTWAYLPSRPTTTTGWEGWTNTVIPKITFQIKGNHIGAIRVYAILEVAEISGTQNINAKWIPGTFLVTEDWAYLPSGVGKVDVLSTNSIGNDGTSTTPETGRQYTMYVYAEGSTVQFSVDAMYSGVTMGESSKGWSLRLYDGTGKLRQSWSIPDDVRGKVISYTIPSGAFVPYGNNRWKVVLMNTLFDQSETEIFVVDTLNKIPGTPTVTLDKSQYNEGDTATATFTAQANPNGTGDISKFYVEIKWDSPSSTDYILYPKYISANHISGLTYRASISFTVNKPNKYFYILVWAMDSQNRASGRGDNYAYVKQVYGNYVITFHVVDTLNKPIFNATVAVSGVSSAHTDVDGNATFYLQNKQYSYTISKEGYNPYSSTVFANADKTITVTLQSIFNLVWILVGAIALITIVGGAIYYYKEKKK